MPLDAPVTTANSRSVGVVMVFACPEPGPVFPPPTTGYGPSARDGNAGWSRAGRGPSPPKPATGGGAVRPTEDRAQPRPPPAGSSADRSRPSGPLLRADGAGPRSANGCGSRGVPGPPGSGRPSRDGDG